MNTDKIYLEAEAIDALIDEMTLALKNRLAQHQISAPVMIGIHTGGVWLAEHLHQRLEITEPLGTLDISFYRDDFTRIGMNPQVQPSSLPFSIDDKHIVLVDDVVAGVAEHEVGATAAVHRVDTIATEDDVVVITAAQLVVSDAAIENVVSGTAAQPVVAFLPEQFVATTAPNQGIVVESAV